MVNNDLSSPWVAGVSTRYAIGPELDIGLPFGFGIEVDALYRHEGYQVPAYSALEYHRTSWEFPFLLKKSLSFPVIKPFVEAGYAPRAMEQSFDSGPSHGIVIGGGIQFGIGRLRLSPAVRYTRWSNAPYLLVFADGPSISLTQNQVDILLGISWKIR